VEILIGSSELEKRALVRRWLPAITATAAAAATVLVAVISWTASRSATDQEYVALSMSILASKESSIPSRTWAVEVLSRLSPVSIPDNLASGLISGKSVMPSDLDPEAARRAIRSCLQPVIESDLVKPVDSAELGREDVMRDWQIFGVAQTGQLAKANSRIEALNEALDLCTTVPLRGPEGDRPARRGTQRPSS